MEPVVGIRCFVGDLGAATDAVVERAASARGGYACLCNVHVLMTADRRDDVRDALTDAWSVFPDGRPVSWLLSRQGMRAHRIAGVDLMRAVIDRGRTVGLKHFLFGSTPAVAGALVARYEREFPGCRIVGSFAPAYGDLDSLTGEGIAAVDASRADVVWVSLGAPKQELWIRRHTAELPHALMLGVGAAFDFEAGLKKRAPDWMQTVGLEWLHRFASEPRRLGGRYLSSNSRFVLRALGAHARGAL